ncbi:MAG: nuclear transport factor 2 family protein [Steroidobacteraceae bacterium]
MNFSSTARSVLVATSLSVAMFAGPAMAASSKALSNAELRELQTMVQREKDAREVANIMGLRAAWNAMGQGDKIANLFAKKPADVSFSMNGSHILVGFDKIKSAFGDDATRKQRGLEGMIKLYPQIENKPENFGVGDVRIHSLESPIIEVAEDGQTAKGFWQTSGPALEVARGKPAATIAWENYAVDFIKEDGQWKIWHLHNITLYYYDLDKPFSDQVAATLAPAQGPGGQAAPASSYKAWTPTTPPNQIQLPQPYKTFSETFSYGPPAVAK